MIEVGSKRKNMPPPPHILFEALIHPDRDPTRPWLDLPAGQRPRVLESTLPSLVVWSSLWVARPDATIRFELQSGGGGTDLRWTLSLEEPLPDEATLGSMRQRIGRLIFAALRYSFGQ